MLHVHIIYVCINPVLVHPYGLLCIRAPLKIGNSRFVTVLPFVQTQPEVSTSEEEVGSTMHVYFNDVSISY